MKPYCCGYYLWFWFKVQLLLLFFALGRSRSLPVMFRSIIKACKATSKHYTQRHTISNASSFTHTTRFLRELKGFLMRSQTASLTWSNWEITNVHRYAKPCTNVCNARCGQQAKPMRKYLVEHAWRSICWLLQILLVARAGAPQWWTRALDFHWWLCLLRAQVFSPVHPLSLVVIALNECFLQQRRSSGCCGSCLVVQNCCLWYSKELFGMNCVCILFRKVFGAETRCCK